MRRSSQPSGEDDRILAGVWRGIVDVSIGLEKGETEFEGVETGLREGEEGLREGEEGLVECCHDGLELESED